MHETLRTWPWQPWTERVARHKIRVRAETSAVAGVPLESSMRESISRHFDVVVVVWFLALALAWSMVVIARTPTQADWSTAPQSAQSWNYTANVGN